MGACLLGAPGLGSPAHGDGDETLLREQRRSSTHGLGRSLVADFGSREGRREEAGSSG